MHIQLIKKIKLDGNNCRKSAKVLNELQELGLLDKIDEIIAADQRQPSSEGFALANQYQVESAPFFIVKNEEGLTKVYKAYHRFLKDVFNMSISEEDELSEIMAQNPDLDYI
ncbi:hypothetical protein [Crocosphaera sp.]|uniref:hypothetical protein n=1 Tax=Crocosphaera sp. TaxID=2729996 RepID=UPI002610DA65|nr:hypothetical protein [Crocosphaera sp.]MDJ0582387.1 hypothetical protein [Crocosphaera sp.]